MATSPPYTYYTCPCTEVPSSNSTDVNQTPESDDNQDETLDPYNPRSNFALYQLSDLLFCNECHEIRCPRCSIQEVMYYYCPGCLLETPTTVVKQESNSCTRSCCQCPLCTAPLQLQSFPDAARATNPQHHSEKNGPFILSCPFCAYTTLEIGITLDKSININAQLRRLLSPESKDADDLDISMPDRRTSSSRLISSTSADDVFAPTNQSVRTPDDSTAAGSPSPAPEASVVDPFDALAAFYKNQLDITQPNPLTSLTSSYGLDSPSQLSRLLSTYGVGALKKQRGRLPVMREALFQSEGLLSSPTPHDEEEALAALESAGWEGTASRDQQDRQRTSDLSLSIAERTTGPNLRGRLARELRPVPLQLRSKRAKRCATCRHFLVRPDEKRQGSLRFKIRLLAVMYIPALIASSLTGSFTSTPGYPFPSSTSSGTSQSIDLAQGKPNHVKLTFRNPLYDTVRITLATPVQQYTDATRNRTAKVTILCPSFEVGATADAWSEALEGGDERHNGRDNEENVPEAGKVWERGRNWTSVVMEIVPNVLTGGGGVGSGNNTEGGAKREEGIMEVPIFVRMEYETDEAGEGYTTEGKKDGKKEKEKKVKRELAYWCVVGVGKVLP